ncbi:hypothetical protein FEM48_Zijuj04G0072400 [Ziziphus jujuba var. spinosa]|uniref:Uncharacterized protein n=1 Tax=Ziziphus jujuba var. spinosa TaxID=714518 RepID=A0A978VIJ0_ZIZJJ|nr:hypothetical protein FEM48_Zijuj04G0072400 [Ziziphus jujuba var. spinosa]
MSLILLTKCMRINGIVNIGKNKESNRRVPTIFSKIIADKMKCAELLQFDTRLPPCSSKQPSEAPSTRFSSPDLVMLPVLFVSFSTTYAPLLPSFS